MEHNKLIVPGTFIMFHQGHPTPHPVIKLKRMMSFTHATYSNLKCMLGEVRLLHSYAPMQTATRLQSTHNKRYIEKNGMTSIAKQL